MRPRPDDDTLERIVRLLLVEELGLLAHAIGGLRAANEYRLVSLRAAQNREAMEHFKPPTRPWWAFWRVA